MPSCRWHPLVKAPVTPSAVPAAPVSLVCARIAPAASRSSLGPVRFRGMALSFACCGMSMAGLENLLFDRLGDIAERAQVAVTTNTTSPAPSQLRRNCPSSGGLKLASDDEDNGANKQGKGTRHEKS